MKDNVAVACSGACMFHCLLTPIVIGFSTAGILGEWLASEWVHKFMLVPVVLLAIISLPGSFKKHENYWPSLFGASGIAVMISALMAPEMMETVLTVSGGLLMIVAHLWNRKLSLNLMPIKMSRLNG